LVPSAAIDDVAKRGHGGDCVADEKWRREEGEKRPDVEHLGQVEGCDVVRLVAYVEEIAND
jgi:hypothetical protein